jgi:hypothetical protein
MLGRPFAPGGGAVLLLSLAVFVIGILATVVDPSWVPPVMLVLPLLGGTLLLGRRHMLVVIAAVLVMLVVDVIAIGYDDVRPGSVVTVLVTGGFAYAFAATRDRLGIPGLRSETMLLELRERLRVQGELPPLPAGWHADVIQRSAGGSAFGGDFLVSALGDDGTLEVALVDVSGKGFGAGTRALMLSGALGGLLGAVPTDRFLAAANAYLLRQQWEEGFATAVHVAIDLESGDYLLDSAGHPPAVQFQAGSGRWRECEAQGGLLGVFEHATWEPVRGRLDRGDALMLFTDGLVEVPGRDLALGVDKLLGEANRLVVSTFEGGAVTLIDAVAPDAEDDRALVLLWRSH